MRSDQLSPFIYWAQDESNIFIKIDLKDIKRKELRLTDDSVHFDAFGVGAHGPAKYMVRLKFFDSIQRFEDNEGRHVKMTDVGVQMTLRKQDCQWWPRLLHSTQKPPWLKIDFERWKSEEDDEEEGDLNDTNAENGRAKDVLEDYPDLLEKLKRDEFGYKKEDLKKVYLVLYNLSQFVLFFYILFIMGIRYVKDGPDSMEGTFDAVGNVLKFCQLIQFLEVMHPLFGYTKGSVFVPFIQVTGRAIVLFGMIDSEPRMQTKPVVFYLFFIWTTVEIVRYPYYIFQLLKSRADFLTWMRYSIWIPLYPLGILCEGVIILRNIPYFEETGRFSVEMPNKWNVTFHAPSVMKIYLLILFFPGMYAMMTHMYRARMKKLGVKKPSSKKTK